MDEPTIDPRIYAMIGAASFASAITRTTSTILVVTELTENSRIVVGLLLGVLVAYSTSNIFTMSFFDTVLTLKRLPYLPILFSSDIYKLQAKTICDYMEDSLLYEDSSIYDLLIVLNSRDAIKYDDYIPVLNNPESRKLIGAVRMVDCFEYLGKIGEKLIEEYNNSRYSTSIKMISGKLQNALRISKGGQVGFKGTGISKSLNVSILTSLGNDKVYANVSEEFHKFVETLKGREEQKLALNETFQVVEVNNRSRQRTGGSSFFGSITQQPKLGGTRLKNARTFAGRVPTKEGKTTS